MNSSQDNRQQILLINPKDTYTLGSPSLGIGYLISYSKKIGKNDVYFHDENFIPTLQLDNRLKQTIDEYRPAFIGLTFPSSTVKRVASIIKYIKKNYKNITLFAGGYHPTSDPKATLILLPEFDFLVMGQAERTFAFLGTDWKWLPGVAYLNNSGELIVNDGSATVNNLDDIPIIDRRIYDSNYFRPNYVISSIYGKTVTLMSSRGCPYHCNFCSNKLLQKKVKFHSIDYVLNEIDSIFSQFGYVDYCFFLDVMFLTNWDRTYNLCKAFKSANLFKKTKWAAVVSANVVTKDKVRLMKDAGCFYLSFGFESNASNSLKLMNKKATPEDNENAVHICNELKVLCNSAFLFGIPGERECDIQKTIDFVKKHNLFSTGVNVMKPLPGSPFYDRFIQQGVFGKDIETWHRISSIHHSSEYFNPRISTTVYDDYIRKFQNCIKWKARFNNLRINYKNLVKYSFERRFKLERTTMGINTTRFGLLSSKEYKKETKSHWSKSPCGSNYSDAEFGTKEYFDQVEMHRYSTHPWIKKAVDSFDIKGQNILEIGFGMGTDHLNLARRGGIMHGVDLTPRNLEITSKRFELYGLKTKLSVGDAERLPYNSNTMDFIYSFGVVHHSPDTKAIISEIQRVLKPGGKCWVSVYHKNSIFFWWSVLVVKYLMKGGHTKRELNQQLSLVEYPGTNENMVIRLYKRKEFELLFHQFAQTHSYVRHLLPCDIAYFSCFFKNRCQPSSFCNMLGKRVGWYVVVEALK